jgi:hypothetical protein
LSDVVVFDRTTLTDKGKKLKYSCLDNEQIPEGIVISPAVPRHAEEDVGARRPRSFIVRDGTALYLKIISDRYAKIEDDEAIN